MIIITNVIFNSYNDKLDTQIYGALNGTLYPVLTDNQGRIVTSPNSISAVTVDNLALTAFGDLRSTSLTPVTGWTFNYTLLTGLIKATTSNLGSNSVADGKITLSTGTNSNGSSKIETNAALRYSPGLGALVRFTGLFSTGVANSSQLIGIGDATDGFFFGYNGISFGVLRRRNGVDTWTPQTSWNVDKLDGTGASGMILDKTKGNIYQIQYQWLGYGMIKFFVENQLTGSFILVNEIEYANANTSPSIYNPTLPVMAEVKNTGNVSNLSISTSSSMAFVEGDAKSQAISSRYNYYVETKSVPTNVLTNIFTLRNRSTFNGLANRVRITFDFLSASTEGNNSVNFYLTVNPTISSGTFTNIDTTQSVVEASINAVTVGGKVQLFFTATNRDSLRLDANALNLTLNPGDIVVFQAKSDDSTKVSASLSWIEYY